MSFRRKLLVVFALTVFLSVAAVAWIVASLTRRAFERSDQERTQSLVTQFRREFNRQGDDIVRRVDSVADSDAATRIAIAAGRGHPDYGAYLSQAKSLADSQRLDFLDFADDQDRIISSAESPASFGYKMDWPKPGQPAPQSAFLKKQELPDGTALGLFAARTVTAGDSSITVIGGRKVDKDFLRSLELPSGMRALLYQNFSPSFSAAFLIDSSGTLQQPEKLEPLVHYVQEHGVEATALLHWNSDAADDESMHAIPLEGQDRQLAGVLLVANSRRPYVELKRRIASVALLVAGSGILLAIVLSSWAAARVTRPVEQLAAAAREVAAGNFNTHVESTSSDELGDLADAFNRMTSELTEQRERLVQSERVAAWRELARRLAHELKNPLFPLQLTVENLLRARQQSAEVFDEIFRESTATLLAEISNLKSITARFSDFAKMPQPRLQAVDINETVRAVMQLFQAQLQAPRTPEITCNYEIATDLPAIAADPDLLHRAISNLVLNAMDAMPRGGRLTVRTQQSGDGIRVQVCDTGQGLTPEECERLFTPYYTSKQHGTGLGLAIVQSVVSDHGGRVSVHSEPGRGSTFTIELPRNMEKLAIGKAESANRSQTQ